MSARSARIADGALRRLIAGKPFRPPVDQPVASRPQEERCELCAVPVEPRHRHLLDLTSRELCCACRACAVLFDRPAEDPDPAGDTPGGTAGGAAAGRGGADRYRLVPDRRRLLEGFVLDDGTWAALDVPVRMAFLLWDSAAGRAVLFYPSPGGAVESALEEAVWERLSSANPVLRRLLPDVEALLVNRTGAARQHWIVPVDDCYTLVGLLRTRWKGLAGGPDVWREITNFFTELARRSTTVTPADDHLRT
ncbi:DUF5947 family protein [Nonomuraea sp. LPB2021202275-12-8]|uniref:DUF5947 family protein n=1 Tax=Nonomuraea sp. LPB2021202275-12-8 TaxID=3120159 RepID=UPI00300D7703